MAMHYLKIRTEHYKKILTKEKRAEFRRNDRNFLCADILILKEINSQTGSCNSDEYTGREIACAITHITKVNDVYAELVNLPEFVMLSFQVIEER